MREIKGPDFPTGALIMGAKGIDDAYRTGRGSIIMRAVVEVEEIQNRQCLVVTELPYQVNPDSLAQKIAEHVKDGRLSGIADIRDETSGRTGQRLVIVLKRDAVAKVVLNNLFKHTQLQTNFGANMLALVDGVPRTLPIDAFIRYWVDHQLDVIQRRTAYRLRKAEERIHILRGLLKALDALDEVIALIRRSPTVDEARTGLMELLEIDEIQAQAILDMQLRRLAALERQKIIDDHDELAVDDRGLHRHPRQAGSPARHRLRGARRDRPDATATTGARRSCRSTATCRWRTSSPRRTSSSRSPGAATPSAPGSTPTAASGAAARACAGRRCAARTWSTTSSRRPRTTGCSSSPTSAASTAPRPTSCRMPAATARASTSPTSWPSSRASRSPRCSRCATTRRRPTSCSPRRAGLVKKTRLAEYDSPRSGGLIAVNLRDGDELVGAGLAEASRRPAARLAQGPVGALPRRRRHAAPDGALDLGRHRDEVPQRRLAAGDVGRARRHRPRRVRRVRVGAGQALEGRRSGTSRAAPSTASPSPSCPTRAATSSGR